jgi:hypothetical protein
MLMNAARLKTGTAVLIAFFTLILSVRPASADLDRSRYAAPSELRPGMKGHGRTVMSGTRVDTFEFEIISVMSNAFYPKQDVILVRCAGLKLEHSGIIGGMSGSPCYVRDDQGRDRMIGAVAYGWTFNKDPICGVQPITQMLDVAAVRDPARLPAGSKSVLAATSAPAGTSSTGRFEIGQMVAQVWNKPVGKNSFFSIFNDDIVKLAARPATKSPLPGLEPLKTPVMMTGGNHPQVLEFMRDVFERFAMEPMAAGAPSATTKAEMSQIRMEPGSVLCIPLVTGDISADALGTCTEVDGNRVLGFGHALDAQGWSELPFATGMVHTVVPSVMRSNKLGGSLQAVGTLWGDESTGIFGVIGKSPTTIPVEIVVEDLRGRGTYHCNVVQDENMTAGLLPGTIMEAVYAHSEPPRDHTVRYTLEVEFRDLGTFRASNYTSQSGVYGLGMAAMLPTATLMNSPFGKAKVTRARAEVKIEDGAHLAQVDQVLIDKSAYKPGETVNARVRFAHFHGDPLYTEETYSLKLPDDIDNGDYTLMVGDSQLHMIGMRNEKPHLFRAESMSELLSRYNQMSSIPDNKLFMRLTLPKGGLAIKSTELPDLPLHKAQIFNGAKRNDVQSYREALVREYELPFALDGGQTLTVTVNRRADQ